MTDSKPQIVMRSGPIPGASYYLDKPEVSIGRDLANDIPRARQRNFASARPFHRQG